MDNKSVKALVEALAAGFEALQLEYQQLHEQHVAVQKKLATAQEQYSALAKLCDSGALTTPPLSLVSSSDQQPVETSRSTALEILERKQVSEVNEAAQKVRVAVSAAQTLRHISTRRSSVEGVKIWSGPSADRPEHASSIMPSISESSLEQDFTIEGRPSKLGCPFASMTNKKLSSHAASVLSRYNQPLDSLSRINGKESLDSRRASFADPIKADICGLSDHDHESPLSERAIRDQLDKLEVGVCPIRFLDQHSPEEVATYFENHKHELPRSHEVCVKRYQSNEAQIRQLDAKYGSLVSMIQGLGAKHKDMLPNEPQEAGDTAQEAKTAEKVHQWASSVSAQIADAYGEDAGNPEERQQHFERSLRDIRVGESSSRPWGIQVPAKHREKANSETSSQPAQVESRPPMAAAQDTQAQAKKPKKCPFDPSAMQESSLKRNMDAQPEVHIQSTSVAAEYPQPAALPASADDHSRKQPQMLFSGPVFIGYSAEDAARILRDSGMGQEK